VALEERWPVLARYERALEWLGIWADLGRAPRTIDAYARGLAEYLLVCERDGAVWSWRRALSSARSCGS
jgi:integrase/recombinase XerD